MGIYAHVYFLFCFYGADNQRLHLNGYCGVNTRSVLPTSYGLIHDRCLQAQCYIDYGSSELLITGNTRPNDQ